MSFFDFKSIILSRFESFEKRNQSSIKIKTRSYPFVLIWLKLFFSIIRYVPLTLTKRLPEKNKLNISIQLHGGVGDQCMAFQWVFHLIQRLNKEHVNYSIILVTNNVDFIKLMSEGVNEIANIVSINEWNHKYKSHLDIFILGMVKIAINDPESIKHFAPEFLNDLVRYDSDSEYNFFKNFTNASEAYHLMQLCFLRGFNHYDMLGSCNLCSFDSQSVPYFHVNLEEQSRILNKYNLEGLPFIVISSSIGAVFLPDGIQIDSAEALNLRQNANRLIPVTLGNSIVREIKKRFPLVKVVQIGEPGSEAFAGVDLSLIGVSSFIESIYIVGGAEVLLCSDNGFSHIRKAMNKRAVVLFGPSYGCYVGYRENINIQGSCSFCRRKSCGCMFLTKHWDVICPAGYGRAECMYSIDPHHVVDSIAEILEGSE